MKGTKILDPTLAVLIHSRVFNVVLSARDFSITFFFLFQQHKCYIKADSSFCACLLVTHLLVLYLQCQDYFLLCQNNEQCSNSSEREKTDCCQLWCSSLPHQNHRLSQKFHLMFLISSNSER